MKTLKIQKQKGLNPRNHRQHLLFTVLSLLLLSCTYLQAQTIAPYLFGQNAWMPGASNLIGSGTPFIPPYNYGGSLSSHWQDVQDSHCVSVRIGGDAYDNNAGPPNFSPNTGPPTTDQLLALIYDIQNHGGEPIVQIAYGDGNATHGSLTSTQAAQYVTDINIRGVNTGSILRRVKYWSIGNEPDKYSANNTALLIAGYIKTYSSVMKGVAGQSDIQIMVTTYKFTPIEKIDFNSRKLI